MKNTGQSTLEYAVIIAVIVGALLAMQIYLQRGVQGKLRESADSIGQQYSAGNVTAKYVTEQKAQQKTKETFGLTEGGTATKGVSYYKVEKAAEVVHKAQGEGAEKITQDLKDEELVP
jgi:hypothetical protein